MFYCPYNVSFSGAASYIHSNCCQLSSLYLILTAVGNFLTGCAHSFFGAEKVSEEVRPRCCRKFQQGEAMLGSGMSIPLYAFATWSRWGGCGKWDVEGIKGKRQGRRMACMMHHGQQGKTATERPLSPRQAISPLLFTAPTFTLYKH